MTYIELWSNTNTIHVKVNQLKIYKKTSPEESEPTYKFQVKSARSQHWFELDRDVIKDVFMTRGPGFFKVCALNVFQVKPISIGLHFLLQLGL